MWLGDVAKLPESEQFYLRSENVDSDHSIGSDFYDGQIECKFTELPKEKEAIKLRSAFVEAFDKKFKMKLTRLDEELIDTIATLAAPIVDTEKERRHIFDSLNRVFLESLDNKVLEKAVKELGVEPIGSGSLKRLQTVLEAQDKTGQVGLMLMPFYVLYDLRVAYSHLTSNSSKRELVDSVAIRLGIAPNFDIALVYGLILDLIIEALTFFIEIVERPVNSS